MTKEELEKEAEEKGVEYTDKQKRTISVHEDSDYSWGQVEQAYEQGALDFAEPREKRIAELEAQIEKMKCCGNCENRYGQEKCKDCHNYSKWKFKQAEQFYEEIVE